MLFSRLADIFGPSPDTLERVFRHFSVEIVTNHTFALTGREKTDVSTVRKSSRRPPGVRYTDSVGLSEQLSCQGEDGWMEQGGPTCQKQKLL